MFFGGNSSEREVSLRSGNGVAQALRGRGLEVELFDVSPGESMRKLNLNNPPDIVFLALHGAFGEDGTVQGFLQSMKIPFVGCNVFASAVSFHKGLTKKLLKSFGLPVPDSHDLQGPAMLEAFVSQQKPEFFDRKWFLKPAREGSTIGIERFDAPLISPSERKKTFLTLAQKAMTFDPYLLVEEWLEGPELTCAVMFGRALPIVEIRPLSHFYDFQSKYTKGQTEYLCPAPLTPEDTKKVQDVTERAFAVLECKDYGRLDLILTSRGPYILEMNTLPGMTETSLVPKAAAAAGYDFGEFLEKLLRGSLERQRA